MKSTVRVALCQAESVIAEGEEQDPRPVDLSKGRELVAKVADAGAEAFPCDWSQFDAESTFLGGTVPESLGSVIAADIYIDVEAGKVTDLADALCRLPGVLRCSRHGLIRHLRSGCGHRGRLTPYPHHPETPLHRGCSQDRKVSTHAVAETKLRLAAPGGDQRGIRQSVTKPGAMAPHSDGVCDVGLAVCTTF